MQTLPLLFTFNSFIMNVYSHTGHGNFGSVLKGEYTKGNGEKIPVAVKKLKSEEMNNPKVKCYQQAEAKIKDLSEQGLSLQQIICLHLCICNREYQVTTCISKKVVIQMKKKSPLVFYVLFQSEILHEAEVMMKLDHPNIVRIIGTVLAASIAK